MPQSKAISRKHLSLIDIFTLYSTPQSQIQFFFDLKWPNGFVYPHCGYTHYTYYSAKGIYECKCCHHQTTLKANTIMQDSKLTLFQWILMIYLICDSVNGISALELSRRVGIGYTSARLNSRKIKYSMMLRNIKYPMCEHVIEHDEILLGAPTKNGKRGLGTDKQIAYMNVGIEDNVYPAHIRILLAEDFKNESIKKSLLRISECDDTIVKTDGKIGIKKALAPQFGVDMNDRDYNHLKWVNIITSNLKSFIQGTYHGIAKKYLIFHVSEFEWRFNRRKMGKDILKAGLRTVFACHPMTNDMLVCFFAS